VTAAWYGGTRRRVRRRTWRSLVVLDGEVDGAGAPVDGDVEVALAPFAIGGLQLGQVLDVDMDEAEVIVLELALTRFGLVRGRRWPPAQSLGTEDPPDAVAVEVRQEVADHEGEVVEGEVGRLAQSANHGTLDLKREQRENRHEQGNREGTEDLCRCGK
jgi:hypothetical protein